MYEDTIKPVIALSLGDPAGVSPEIVAKNLPTSLSKCRPVVFGHWPSLEAALERFDISVEINVCDSVAIGEPDRVTVVNCGPDSGPIDSAGEAAALAQFESLEKAVDAVLAGECGGLVTGPVSKGLVATVSPGFTGHTEYLARRAGVRHDEVTMVFASRRLTVGLVSTHLAMREVADAVTRQRLERTLAHVIQMLRALHPEKKPRVGVAALNPHAGEDGILGSEEDQIIGPFCKERSGPEAFVYGPVPADTLFRDAFNGEYDGVVAAYHDQAMIPLKLGGVGKMVNATMGLPFVRTSPDHGVAYDIAGKGVADPSGMGLAIELAAELKSERL